MNRIILIGNGFDLAHNLKTSYKSFIDAYWKKKKEAFTKLYQEERITHYEDEDIVVNNIVWWVSVFDKNREQLYGYKSFVDLIRNGHIRGALTFKNCFLQIISEKSYLQNWVDIEEEYYMQLKAIITFDNNKKNKYGIVDLNNEFAKIKSELVKYLINIQEQAKTKNDKLFLQIYSSFHLEDFTTQTIPTIREEYRNVPKEEENYDRIFDFLGNHLKRNSLPADYEDYLSMLNLCPKDILFLNFNYTNTESEYQLTSIGEQFNNHNFNRYLKSDLWRDMCANRKIIHIHGELNNPNNPIIFGYGDEQDEIHKEIEKLGGEYLDNVKTINYLKTPNYKNLLSFIENGLYQVFIMGHSCGLSDKTLLNTLFEHKNCVSIKPFFHEWTDNEGVNRSNYDDIIKNVYRCFTDKALMREKVVNLEYCKLLN
jgi:hypothetical protein